MKIILNGKEEIIPAGTTVERLVSARGLIPDHIIVEYNCDLVKKETWPGIVLKENDRLEILRFVGGG
ncbi:MAG: sulfur carrier protein ThiS [Bacillota bacterium]